MPRPIWTALCLLLCLLPATALAAPRCVRYPAQEADADPRARYPLAVLYLALARSGTPTCMVPSPVRAPQTRALRLLARGDLDVVWSVTTPERERQVRLVRFPIDRGLIGWRVLLVHRDAAARFARVRTVDDLRRFVGVQGHDWPDLAILRANGLPMAASPHYASLFPMLERGYVDYFPRSVAEVGGELRARPDSPLAVAPGVLLQYPSALYFFVHPSDTALATTLEQGLDRAHRDGSLQRLFERTYGAELAALDLERRTRIPLRNPDAPASLPRDRADLWFQPGAAP